MTTKVLLKQVGKGSNFISSPLSFHVILSLVCCRIKGADSEAASFHLWEQKLLVIFVSHLCSDYQDCNINPRKDKSCQSSNLYPSSMGRALIKDHQLENFLQKHPQCCVQSNRGDFANKVC
ncbi:hypothetical protein SLA2020_346570 [Shorea laevis]